MAKPKNKVRDERILKKIQEVQKELWRCVKEFGIGQPADLSRVDPVVRRGVIQYVGDIFELVKMLSDSTAKELAWSNDLIRSFRNTIVHNYGSVDNVQAFAWIRYCVTNEMFRRVSTVLSGVQEHNATRKQ